MANVNEAHIGIIYNLLLTEDVATPGAQQAVLCLTSLTPSFEMEAIDLTPCRGDTTNGNWRRRIPSTRSGTIEAEGYVKMSNDWEPKRFFDALDTGTRLAFTIEPRNQSTGVPIVGGKRTTGFAWLTSLSEDYPAEDVTTYSISLAVDGKPVTTIIV